MKRARGLGGRLTGERRNRMRRQWSGGRQLTWLRSRLWYGRNNINIWWKAEFHQLDRLFGDGTKGNKRKLVKRGIKMA